MFEIYVPQSCSCICRCGRRGGKYNRVLQKPKVTLLDLAYHGKGRRVRAVLLPLHWFCCVWLVVTET